MCQCGLVYSGSNLMSSKYSRMDPESCNIPNRVRRVDQSMTPIHMCPQKKYFRKIQIFSEIANSDMVESASHPHPHTYGGAPSKIFVRHGAKHSPEFSKKSDPTGKFGGPTSLYLYNIVFYNSEKLHNITCK